MTSPSLAQSAEAECYFAGFPLAATPALLEIAASNSPLLQPPLRLAHSLKRLFRRVADGREVPHLPSRSRGAFSVEMEPRAGDLQHAIERHGLSSQPDVSEQVHDRRRSHRRAGAQRKI